MRCWWWIQLGGDWCSFHSAVIYERSREIKLVAELGNELENQVVLLIVELVMVWTVESTSRGAQQILPELKSRFPPPPWYDCHKIRVTRGELGRRFRYYACVRRTEVDERDISKMRMNTDRLLYKHHSNS